MLEFSFFLFRALFMKWQSEIPENRAARSAFYYSRIVFGMARVFLMMRARAKAKGNKINNRNGEVNSIRIPIRSRTHIHRRTYIL